MYNKQLTDDIIARVARDNGIEPAALKAVSVVESAGNGFLPDGRCKILFEGHIFWRQLVIAGISPQLYTAGNSDILYEVWDKTKYKGGAAEYSRLEKAMKIHRKAALKSASWGMFQIMGFNHKYCGYDDVEPFVADMNESAEKQLTAAVKFLKSLNLIDYMNARNWRAFASRYNGHKYADNQYDLRLEKAYYDNITLNSLPA